MKKFICIISFVFALFVIPFQASGQYYRIHVSNPSFEATQAPSDDPADFPSDGWYYSSNGPYTAQIPGWTIEPSAGVGTFRPYSNAYAYRYYDGWNVAYSNGGGFKQTLGSHVRANTNYRLWVFVCDRLDGGIPLNKYSLSILATDASGDSSLETGWGPDPYNSCLWNSVNYTVGASDSNIGKSLSVRLSSTYNGQTNFDSVILEATPLQLAGKATIYGIVYEDINGDGNWNYNIEPTLIGISISLEKGGVTLDTDVTDMSGYYEFVIDEAGTYRVEETTPAGHGSTTPDIVTINSDLSQNARVDFGDVYNMSPYAIHGTVFVDENLNGIMDSNESGISNVTVEIRKNGSSLATKVTDWQGYYSYEVIADGFYEVVEATPVNYISTTPDTVLVNVDLTQNVPVLFGDYYGTDTIVGSCFCDFDFDYDVDGKDLSELVKDGVTPVVLDLCADYYGMVNCVD